MTPSTSDHDRIPLGSLKKIDELCDRFEQERESGRDARIEDYLKEVDEPARTLLLRFLLRSELEFRCQRGESPTQEEYTRRFPAHASEVAEEFADFPWQEAADDALPEASKPDGSADDADESRQTDWPSTLAGRYQVKSLIGSGGSATVLLAFDEQLGRCVAIKLPRSDRRLDVDLYVNEAQTVAQLTHPSIVQVYDVGRDPDDRPFVVMQYIEGRSLAKLLKAERPPPAETAQLMAQIADAVHHAHRHGFVHRDLKPSNILLDHDGNPYVSDFGLALHERAQARHRGDDSGTPLYRSPEQVRGEADWIDGRIFVVFLNSLDRK